ncbi:hypothetical protein K1T71_015247 [Dendrolimus kikuchii]|nr:hypothetical protein K1T71_015247 [Dendrolimus kikuchii]
MMSRSARLIKLATKHYEDKNGDNENSIDRNISPNLESPAPNSNELIQLHELLGDVLNENEPFDNHEYNEPIASTSSNSVTQSQNNIACDYEIHLEITPMPSPMHQTCNEAFCVTLIENEDPPILTSDDLYGNLPTPSMTSTTSVYTPTSTKSVQTRQSRFKTDIGKKKLQHKEDWVVTKRKTLKNQGKGFTNHRGKQVQEKQLQEVCNEKCRLKCSTKFSERQRMNVFEKFWKLGDRQRQWEFVIQYTEKVPKRRQTTEVTKHDRQNTFRYFLPNEEKQKTKVCKTMFINTISTGERIISTAWKKYDGEINVREDKRGKYEHKKRIIDDDMIRSVCDHVNSFPLVESHYVRQNSNKLYLEGVKSASRMFSLYCEWFDADKYGSKALTKRQYRDILNANFNIGFHKPKKDLCDICHIYNNKNIPTEEEKSAFLKHQTAKNVARHLKQQDKNEAQTNKEIIAATFDFEKVLITPHGDVSVFYYKRKLSTLNFTLYELATKEATCFMWHEAIAKRGANEVSSCIYQFIKQKALQGVKSFRLWSDNCAGQNRNRIVFALYLLAVKEFGVTITHRFLEKGHTQNEGDSVHSSIERASDRKLIYVPEEWYCLVLKEMTTSDILDFKSLLSNKNWNKNTDNEKIQWTRLREVKVHAQHYDRIEYKYNFEDEPKTVIVLRSGNRSTNRLSRDFQIKQAYNGDLLISRDKHKDLMNLCQNGIIPEKYHSFYENLKFCNNAQEILSEDD